MRGGGGEILRRADKGTSRLRGCRLPRGETSGCQKGGSEKGRAGVIRGIRTHGPCVDIYPRTYGHFYNPLPRSSVPLDSFDPLSLELIHHLGFPISLPLALSLSIFSFLLFFLRTYVVYSLAEPLIPFNLVYWVQYGHVLYIDRCFDSVVTVTIKATTEIIK